MRRSIFKKSLSLIIVLCLFVTNFAFASESKVLYKDDERTVTLLESNLQYNKIMTISGNKVYLATYNKETRLLEICDETYSKEKNRYSIEPSESSEENNIIYSEYIEGYDSKPNQEILSNQLQATGGEIVRSNKYVDIDMYYYYSQSTRSSGAPYYIVNAQHVTKNGTESNANQTYLNQFMNSVDTMCSKTRDEVIAQFTSIGAVAAYFAGTGLLDLAITALAAVGASAAAIAIVIDFRDARNLADSSFNAIRFN